MPVLDRALKVTAGSDDHASGAEMLTACNGAGHPVAATIATIGTGTAGISASCWRWALGPLARHFTVYVRVYADVELLAAWARRKVNITDQ